MRDVLGFGGLGELEVQLAGELVHLEDGAVEVSCYYEACLWGALANGPDEVREFLVELLLAPGLRVVADDVNGDLEVLGNLDVADDCDRVDGAAFFEDWLHVHDRFAG